MNLHYSFIIHLKSNLISQYNNNYNNYTQTITMNEFEVYVDNIMEVMEDNERNAFIYKFLRFYNASIPLSSREYIQLNTLNILDKKRFILNVFNK